MLEIFSGMNQTWSVKLKVSFNFVIDFLEIRAINLIILSGWYIFEKRKIPPTVNTEAS